MSLLDRLSDRETWESFYRYKTSLMVSGSQEKTLRSFIDREAYLPVCEHIKSGKEFPLPRRGVISKMSTGKKRIVYMYPEPENTVLKLLTWLLLRTCDGLFSKGLYSFRPGRTAKDAIRALRSEPGIGSMWSYKADISNYFNSVDISLFLPILKEALSCDEALFRFLSGLLLEDRVLEGEEIIREPKGIMAGTPQSAFYANLFLMDLDRRFEERKIPYARYSDDVIFFAPSREEVLSHAELFHEILSEKGLTINPEKVSLNAPEDGWTFLGFEVKGGTVDIAPATLRKLKAKMRRKTRALARWRDRGGRTGEQAASAFIRVFNRKLLESPTDRELSWSYWFFSVIDTTERLSEIDHYAQDCLRTLISGRHTKARFDVRYPDLKALGYRSLVHAYYDHQKEE